MEKHLFKIYENSRFVVCIFDVIQMFPCFQPLYWAGISNKRKNETIKSRETRRSLCLPRITTSYRLMPSAICLEFLIFRRVK